MLVTRECHEDDGLNAQSIREADIVLTGISRTGKTPTSMYMAMLGWKVANVPLVQGIEPPKDLFLIDPRTIRNELDYALSIFRRRGFSVIKVTNKPIESVANEIIEILSLRFNEQSRKQGDRL